MWFKKLLMRNIWKKTTRFNSIWLSIRDTFRLFYQINQSKSFFDVDMYTKYKKFIPDQSQNITITWWCELVKRTLLCDINRQNRFYSLIIHAMKCFSRKKKSDYSNIIYQSTSDLVFSIQLFGSVKWDKS